MTITWRDYLDLIIAVFDVIWYEINLEYVELFITSTWDRYD